MGTNNQGSASEPDDAERVQGWELRAVVDNIPGFIWSLGADGELRYLNRKVEDYTGRRLEELREPHWREVMHPDDIQPFVAAWISAVTNRLPIVIDFRLRRRDGVYRWFRTTGTPLVDERGAVSGWCGVDIDIDDRKCFDIALHQSEAQLARAAQIAVAGELAASMANAIAQPLAAVVANGYIGKRVIEMDRPNLGQLAHTLDSIIDGATAVAAIAKRIYRGVTPTPPVNASLNINATIEEVLRLEELRLHESKIDVSTRLCRELPLIRADIMLMKQVLTNLIRNSVEAMAAHPEGPRQLSIETQRKGMRITVEFVDTGTGFSEGARLCDAFYTTKNDRLGLGLTVAKSIIESYDGSLWTGHNTPRGAIIGFSVPIQ
jgi:PAS domain S-box-containing protein